MRQRRGISKRSGAEAGRSVFDRQTGSGAVFYPGGNDRTAAHSPQEIALEIWNDIMGGTFGGRVNMNLREDKHWSYGARTAFQFARGDSTWVTQSAGADG